MTTFETNDPEEIKVLLRALGRLKSNHEAGVRKNAERGWKPFPGARDLNSWTIDIIDNLLARLPYPESDQETHTHV